MTEPPATEASEDPPPKKFGAFGGVFTPSLLTILGVIMFLRFSTVVGYAGLWYTLLILAAAKAVSVITGLSVASIATNMRVKGGGAYYLISRSLGVEFGGVIAVFFYIAQAVAVTLYVVGFTEAIFSAGSLSKKNREWRDHPIRVIRPVVRRADIENIETAMQEQLALARIEAELFIVPTDTPLHAVRQRMQPSALLLRGFDPPDEETDDETRQNLVSDLERTLELPGDIIFVYNACEVSIEA